MINKVGVQGFDWLMTVLEGRSREFLHRQHSGSIPDTSTLKEEK